MSIHAQLTSEALSKLQSQQRNSTISSIVISLLVILLMGIILLWILLPPIDNSTAKIVAYTSAELSKDAPQQQKQLKRSFNKTPVAPSSAMAKAIAADIPSNIAIPTPDALDPMPSLEFGSADDFNDGWGGEMGSDGGGGFGALTKISGSIPGHLYDFKQTVEGKPVEGYDTQNRSHFTGPINKLHRARYSLTALRKLYKAKQNLHVRYIAIPFSDASEGPRFFKAEKEIKPSGWIASYSGQITAPKTGTFRFVGAGDDYLSVMINRKFRLVSAWSDINSKVSVSGANARKHPNHQSALGTAPLAYGSWFSANKGDSLNITINLGERPGGKVGFMLMIEEKGAEYRKTTTGRNILPPFTMGILSPEDILNLGKFTGWEWETENIPVFHAKD